MKRTNHPAAPFFLLLLLLTVSCGGVDSDAKKAASLTNRSIERTSQLKLDDAEKLYKKSQAIIRKYESHPKQEKFSRLYRQYRDEGRVVPQEQDCR
jgi:hypothetical protein